MTLGDNQAAISAVEDIWRQFVKARALCPYINKNAVGATGYLSADWYIARGAVYFVNLASPLTAEDVDQLNAIAGFINRSFVVALFGILESIEIVPYGTWPIAGRSGWEHVTLLKHLRHCFAHGWQGSGPKDKFFNEARPYLEKLFPDEASKDSCLPTTINTILETLKDESIRYIKETN